MIYSLYDLLYRLLKGAALDALLGRPRLNEYEKEALATIARLPHPAEVTLGQMWEVCDQCLRGSLEGVYYPVEQDGATARRLREALDEAPRPPETPLPRPPRGAEPDFARLEYMMNLNLDSLQRLSFQIRGLQAIADLNLKGRCPFCASDLIEVLEATSTPKVWELKLRCRQPTQPGCHRTEWVVQTVHEV